jgi:hypothetical protein
VENDWPSAACQFQIFDLGAPDEHRHEVDKAFERRTSMLAASRVNDRLWYNSVKRLWEAQTTIAATRSGTASIAIFRDRQERARFKVAALWSRLSPTDAINVLAGAQGEISKPAPIRPRYDQRPSFLVATFYLVRSAAARHCTGPEWIEDQ